MPDEAGAMGLDHLSFGTRDIAATRAFYEGKLGFPVLIQERMLMQEGGTVEHIFFDCGINRGLGVPS
jgi:catechol 2,3-dioxygenase-like lactoylglutathione lyase family enzyme